MQFYYNTVYILNLDPEHMTAAATVVGTI